MKSVTFKKFRRWSNLMGNTILRKPNNSHSIALNVLQQQVGGLFYVNIKHVLGIH